MRTTPRTILFLKPGSLSASVRKILAKATPTTMPNCSITKKSPCMFWLLKVAKTRSVPFCLKYFFAAIVELNVRRCIFDRKLHTIYMTFTTAKFTVWISCCLRLGIKANVFFPHRRLKVYTIEQISENSFFRSLRPSQQSFVLFRHLMNRRELQQEIPYLGTMKLTSYHFDEQKRGEVQVWWTRTIKSGKL